MTVREHLTKHDREIAAIRKLILTGMKMLNELSVGLRDLQVSQRELQTSHRALQASQRETDRQLQALIRSLRGSTNGHTTRKVE